MSSNKIVFIVGTTATGKSEISVGLAKKLGGSIVNCDSLQVYKDLKIGTAKPSPSSMKEVPHFLFSFLGIGESYTAGQYVTDAEKIIEENISQSHLFFVGGTGFYFKALEHGMYDLEPVNNEVVLSLRLRLEQEGLSSLYEELQKMDAEYAKKIAPQDTYRVLRGLSIMKSGSKTITEIRREHEDQNRGLQQEIIKIGLFCDRDLLRERVAQRIRKMLDMGLIAEVEGLLARAPAQWPPLSSIGYKEVCEFLKGGMTQEALFEEILKNTMRLAKRQRTWFKKDKDTQWFDVANEAEKIEQFLGNRL